MEYFDLPYEYHETLQHQIKNYSEELKKQDTIVILEYYKDDVHKRLMEDIFKYYETQIDSQICRKILTLYNIICSDILSTQSLTTSNLKGIIYCQCTVFLSSNVELRPLSVTDCNNAEHPLNLILTFLTVLINDVCNLPPQKVFSMIGTSLIIQTMLPFFTDIVKDFDTIEQFFLEKYTIPKT